MIQACRCNRNLICPDVSNDPPGERGCFEESGCLRECEACGTICGEAGILSGGLMTSTCCATACPTCGSDAHHGPGLVWHVRGPVECETCEGTCGEPFEHFDPPELIADLVCPDCGGRWLPDGDTGLVRLDG